MIEHFNTLCRNWARERLLTHNTIRYRVEFPRIKEAFVHIGRQRVVVDGGAGGGVMLKKVYEAGFCENGIGLEPDPQLFSIMKANFASLPNLVCQQDDLLDLSLKSESVDCAMSTQVLEHIVDHEKAASELGRIVKPGGHLIISVPHPPEPFHTPGHVREGYTEADLIALFPSPAYELLYTGYSMTRPTMDRTSWASRLPFRGFYIPVSWADRETGLSPEERRSALPYGITCLFRKK
ncbi:MAG: class I SAM-dependent methyltransferase [Verrucomicrobiaceae bacterium]|nr:MAG: class I SAM-dependent methyltransferase [Verrucomicrobiaceae bacterium]